MYSRGYSSVSKRKNCESYAMMWNLKRFRGATPTRIVRDDLLFFPPIPPSSTSSAAARPLSLTYNYFGSCWDRISRNREVTWYCDRRSPGIRGIRAGRPSGRVVPFFSVRSRLTSSPLRRWEGGLIRRDEREETLNDASRAILFLMVIERWKGAEGCRCRCENRLFFPFYFYLRSFVIID